MSRLTPFQPIREPQKHVTQEEMWEKLAKHAKPKVSLKIPNAGETPKAELRPPLEWLKPVRTGELSAYIATACGMFTVSKDVSGQAVTYTAWSCSTKPATNLGCRTLPDDAKALCEMAR